jgi:hypothetical protein
MFGAGQDIDLTGVRMCDAVTAMSARNAVLRSMSCSIVWWRRSTAAIGRLASPADGGEIRRLTSYDRFLGDRGVCDEMA